MLRPDRYCNGVGFWKLVKAGGNRTYEVGLPNDRRDINKKNTGNHFKSHENRPTNATHSQPSRLDRLKSLPPIQISSDLRTIIIHATSIARHLESLARDRTTHIRRLRGREQRWSGQIVDTLLPFVAGFFGWVHVLQTLTLDLLDGIADPTDLDLNGGWAVGE